MDSVGQTKRCSKCGEVKGLDAFHRVKRTSERRRAKCRDCRSIASPKTQQQRTWLRDGFKRCPTCKQVKKFDDFSIARDRKSGRHWRCRSCSSKPSAKFIERQEKRLQGLKFCSACDSFLPVSSFGKCKTKGDGKSTYCLVCDRKRRDKWLSVPENKLKLNQAISDWAHRNKLRIRENRRRLYQKDPKRFKIKASVGNHRYHRRLSAAKRTFTPKHWANCLNYWNNRCAVCGRTEDLFYTIAMDHWIPVSSPNCPGHVPHNIIPLCHSKPGGVDACNNTKSSLDPIEWLMDRLGPAKGAAKLVKIEAYFAMVRR